MTKTILLAEDRPEDLELTMIALENCNLSHLIVTVSDGEEALDYLLSRNRYSGRDSGNPSLVLLDLKMPKVDGVEVLKTIRFTPGIHDTPVIIFTTSNEVTDVQRCKMLGVNDYLIKPFEWSVFQKLLCKTLHYHLNV